MAQVLAACRFLPTSNQLVSVGARLPTAALPARHVLFKTMNFLIKCKDDHSSGTATTLSAEEASLCRVLKRFSSQAEVGPGRSGITVPIPFSAQELQTWRKGAQGCNIKALRSGIQVLFLSPLPSCGPGCHRNLRTSLKHYFEPRCERNQGISLAVAGS